MIGIDLVDAKPYLPVFHSWFLPAQVLANFVFPRWRTRLPVAKVLGVDIAITGLSWLVIAGVPLMPLLTWELVLWILGLRDGGPMATMIPVFVVSAFVAAGCQVLFLRVLRQPAGRSEFWILAASTLFCSVLAFYRMCVFAIAHPPEA